jgi:hypothetical protein
VGQGKGKDVQEARGPGFLCRLCSRTSSKRQGLEIGFCEGFGAIYEQKWLEIEKKKVDEWYSLV